jgi:hypothetical protein
LNDAESGCAANEHAAPAAKMIASLRFMFFFISGHPLKLIFGLCKNIFFKNEAMAGYFVYTLSKTISC